MREVAKIEYETIIESDVSEQCIYAFKDEKDIAFLCRKQNVFYWKCLTAVNMVWYEEYETIEKAIEELMKRDDYKKRKTSAIMEFNTTEEFVKWAYSEYYG